MPLNRGTDDILVSYTRDEKILSIDIDGVSKTLQCHMFDVRERQTTTLYCDL
uniref:Uncharacterized protein n=1 Tax=Rhizophagus irregularis (strain DAOM 181602 / DAOM 197198 / MUCL 43194) TaxID=747089 RepID=U9TAY7_RHIID